LEVNCVGIKSAVVQGGTTDDFNESQCCLDVLERSGLGINGDSIARIIWVRFQALQSRKNVCEIVNLNVVQTAWVWWFVDLLFLV
jgi:hypothetical protein